MTGEGRIRGIAEMSVVLRDKDGKPVVMKPEDCDHEKTEETA